MSVRPTKIDAELAEYLRENFSAEDDFLSELCEEAAAFGMPEIQISSDQGKFLQFLMKAIRAESCLEIGSLGGYSAIMLARALPPGGKLTAVEINPEYADFIRKKVDQANLSNKIEVVAQDGRKYLKELSDSNTFDFVFVDADKRSYLKYLDLCAPRMRKGGILAFDNALAYGYVTKAKPERDPEEVKSIKKFNKIFVDREDFFVALATVGDGVIAGVKL